MKLERFFEMHELLDGLRRRCVTDYWEQNRIDDPLVPLGPRQIGYLFTIMRHQPCSLGDIMHHTGLSAPAASAAVEKLVRAGIVRRETNPENRRSIHVSVEPAIRTSLEAIERSFRDRIEQLLSDCTPEECRKIEESGELLVQKIRGSK